MLNGTETKKTNNKQQIIYTYQASEKGNEMDFSVSLEKSLDLGIRGVIVQIVEERKLKYLSE